MTANATDGGIDISVSTFVLKMAAVAVAFLVLGLLVAQTQPQTDFNGVLIGIFYSLGGLMLVVIVVGIVGDLVNQVRRG
jgi:nitrogen fixation/metabolism regulation signal transduction histidine kinase